VAGENALRELPPAIAGLVSLEELHANDNPLAALPEMIGLLPRLRVLNVSHARSADPAQPRLATLPRSLDALAGLETLHIAGNRLFCAGGGPDPGLAPERLRGGSIPRLHGLLAQDCGARRGP
jgi:Leucine-rich repeat (LRR) protein